MEQKQIILFRDGNKCPICGKVAREVNHRANRGSGGFRAANTLANACAICWECNGLIESDADYAEKARERGVKISKHDDPREVEYFHPLLSMRVLLQDDGGYRLANL